jgi:hypothetical protein
LSISKRIFRFAQYQQAFRNFCTAIYQCCLLSLWDKACHWLLAWNRSKNIISVILTGRPSPGTLHNLFTCVLLHDAHTLAILRFICPPSPLVYPGLDRGCHRQLVRIAIRQLVKKKIANKIFFLIFQFCSPRICRFKYPLIH